MENISAAEMSSAHPLEENVSDSNAEMQQDEELLSDNEDNEEEQRLRSLSRISYEEYEADKPVEKTDPANRILALLQRWHERQKSFDKQLLKAPPKPKKVKPLRGRGRVMVVEEEEKLSGREEMIRDMEQEIAMEERKQKDLILNEIKEGPLRDTQLVDTGLLLDEHALAHEEDLRAAEEESSWVRYMTCDGLPDPGVLSDMNTFMFQWTMEDDEVSINTVEEKSDVVTYILNKQAEIMHFSKTMSKEHAAECEKIADEYRRKLQWWIDMACYRLLRRIDFDMDRVDMKTTRYAHVSSQVVCCLWAPIALPIGIKRAEKERKPLEVQFNEIELTILLPVDIDFYRKALRGIWLAYDHYSIDARSRSMPQLPDEYQTETLDFLQFSRKEYEERMNIQEQQRADRRLRREERKNILESMKHPPVAAPVKKSKKKSKKSKKVEAAAAAATASSPVAIVGDHLPYLPTPEEIVQEREEEVRREIRKFLFLRCEKTEINLRKYRIIGGVFRLDLMTQPPQPKDLGRDSFLTTLELPKKPNFEEFYRGYQPPPPAPDDERTPEVIEAEMKALETAMEALVLVTLKLPSSVLWFEPPLVAHWVPEKEMWSTRDIHDLKYNEEKQVIAFRTGKLGIHGLAALRYVNLPFQNWELKPEMGRNSGGGVILNITAATVQAEFIARENEVCLNTLAGGTSTALKGILGEYMKLHFLVKRMREIGCDLFPERDAPSYTKGLPIKHSMTEKHLRHCMALLCTTYSFAWSRWNATRNFREIVLQFKELHSGCAIKERTFFTLLVTPSRTKAISCTEVSPEFSDLPLDEQDPKFYADLYNLAIHRAGIKSRLIMKNISSRLVSTVIRLLERTNVIGMSS